MTSIPTKNSVMLITTRLLISAEAPSLFEERQAVGKTEASRSFLAHTADRRWVRDEWKEMFMFWGASWLLR
jgi:hypothetical protein